MTTDSKDPKTHASVRISSDGPVTTLVISRPAVRNALNLATWIELAAALTVVSNDTSARVVVLSGGDDHFSAGGDIDSMPRPGPRITSPVERLTVAQGVLKQISDLNVPVIAAVERYAIGAAWGLVLACDLVVAGTTSFFQAPFAKRGLVADSGTAWHLPRRIGHQRAMRYLLAAEKMSAQEALDLGLISHVVPDGEATRRATEIGTELAAGPSESNALTKSLARRSTVLGLADYLEQERLAFALAAHGLNAHEGLTAFTERRVARF